MILLLFLITDVISGNSCKSALSLEGQSLVQLVLGDHQNKDTQSKAISQLMFSGKGLNDLGQWSACNRLTDSRYLVVDFDLTLIQTQIGVCVPKECTEAEIKEIFASSDFSKHDLLTSGIKDKIQVSETKTPDLGSAGVITWIGFCVFGIVIAYGTLVEGRISEEDKKSGNVPKHVECFMCFSFKKNWDSLFERQFNDSTRVLDGARALSVLWVILGHVFLIRFLDVLSNYEDIPTFFESPIASFGYSTTLSVDTFFWLSGFLLGYLTIQEAIKSRGRLNWGLSIILRFLRILPTYIFTLLWVNFIITNWGEGPKFSQIKDRAQKDCSEYWWTNVLFINNIIPDYHGNDCIGQSWYLAADMQIFLICIPVLTMYFKFRKYFTWVFVFFLCLMSFIYRIVIADHYNVYISFFNSEQDQNNYKKIHIAAVARVAPYLLGILSGFVYNYKKFGKTNDPCVKFLDSQLNNRLKSNLIFLFGLLCISLIFWLPVKSWADNENNFMGYSRGFNIFFMGIYNLMSSLAYSCMFLPMLYNFVSIPAAILGHKFWVPLAKASFSIYFVHMAIIRLFIANEANSYNFTKLHIFTDVLFMGLVSVVAGMLVYTTVEAPFGNLLRVLVKNKRTPRKEQRLVEAELNEKEMV